MEILRPNGQRARNAITLIWIVLVLELISIISSYFQYNLLQTINNGGVISDELISENDTREQVIAFIYLIVYIISAVTFIQWFRRAYFNLHQKVNHLKLSEGWAAGSWFVPILSLYRPYKIMEELYQETINLFNSKGIPIYSNLTTSSLSLWWSLWIINNLFGQILFRYSMKAESIDELSLMSIGSIIENIIGIPLALITIKVIKDYSNVEQMLHSIKEVEEPMTT